MEDFVLPIQSCGAIQISIEMACFAYNVAVDRTEKGER